MYKITNGNNFDFTAKYNGQQFAFPAGEAVVCEDAAANHIFGLGDPNKTAIMARHGWATVSNTYQDGLKVLNAFVFEYLSPSYDAPLAAVDQSYGPAPVDQDASAETGADAPAEAGAVEVSAAPVKRGPGRPPKTALVG